MPTNSGASYRKCKFSPGSADVKTRKTGRKSRVDSEEVVLEGGTCNFLVAEEIQAASSSLGEKSALLERVFDIRLVNR